MICSRCGDPNVYKNWDVVCETCKEDLAKEIKDLKELVEKLKNCGNCGNTDCDDKIVTFDCDINHKFWRVKDDM